MSRWRGFSTTKSHSRSTSSKPTSGRCELLIYLLTMCKNLTFTVAICHPSCAIVMWPSLTSLGPRNQTRVSSSLLPATSVVDCAAKLSTSHAAPQYPARTWYSRISLYSHRVASLPDSCATTSLTRRVCQVKNNMLTIEQPWLIFFRSLYANRELRYHRVLRTIHYVRLNLSRINTESLRMINY